MPAPCAPKKWKTGFFFALSPWPCGFPYRWIEGTPPPMSVGERDVSLTSFINILNEKPYDCQVLIDEGLLGRFGLSPYVEPLDEPLASTSGSSLIKRRRREKTRLLPILREGPLPPVPLRGKCRGVVTPENRLLLAPLGREDLERKAALHLLNVIHPLFNTLVVLFDFLLTPFDLSQGLAACDTLFSRYQGVSPAGSGETSAQKAEEKIRRLEKENAQLREAKKEVANHRAQMEKELRRLSKVSADHEKALRRTMEKAVADCPNSE
ncbi:UNVERIFIED_CONTAM: hypothetical protein Sradi_7129500 [Sesamum radiatum]|uniref:Uncharacterized protein n=1 Tax=Sesamum radiatum TaxID=300843 RepID=A0AAW2IZB5_SESRA